MSPTAEKNVWSKGTEILSVQVLDCLQCPGGLQKESMQEAVASLEAIGNLALPNFNLGRLRRSQKLYEHAFAEP